MAKRLTDSEKWRDEWWASLPNDYRMIWLYLVDSCTHAGIWKKDFRGLNFNCNTNITEEDFKSVFGSRIIDRGNFYFLPKFLRFQYQKGLNSNKPAIVSVRKELSLNNLNTIVRESLGNDFLIVKDMDMDKDKDKDQGKDKGVQGGKQFEFANIDEMFTRCFDSLTMGNYAAHFTNIDVETELKDFRLKVSNAWQEYRARDLPGIRNAFQYKLERAKPKQSTTPKATKQEILSALRE